MNDETIQQRSERIIKFLKEKYPGKEAYDLDGRGMHFVCEIEPVTEHPEYDRAIEVIIQSKPHKHIKMTQYYTVLEGSMDLHLDDTVVTLHKGDKQTVVPGVVHWATSDNKCLVELYSKPGWTKEDHIVVD